MRPDERRWLLLRTFYNSYRSFHALLGQYERRVLAFAERDGVDRRELKLTPDELGTLLDPLALTALRDGDLAILRECSHKLFRTPVASDPFDMNVASIYHEVSLLKEEHWAIREEGMTVDPSEYERYYREVNVYYPKRLRHVRNLYGRARKRLEVLLPSMARSQVIVRSVFLFGDRLVRDIYRNGVADLYGHMYPDGGALKGYASAAKSFLDAGFGAEAVSAFDLALAAADVLESAAEEDAAGRELAEQRRRLVQDRERALALV